MTLMATEAREVPAVAERLLSGNADAVERLAAGLRARRPSVVVTCARGSSDHAATYGKYLIETLVGVPVASAAPSVASLYGAWVAADGALMLAISQSGRSPDLLATVAAHRGAGGIVVALVNDEASPLAAMADACLPLRAGPERAVAATKSCLGAMVALAQLVAAWSGDAALTAALSDLPARFEAALEADWSAAIGPLSTASRMFVLGRGYGLAAAQEAALKLKETAAIQAEAFSAAEVRHGPMRIVGPGFPVLAFASSDAAGDDVRQAAAEFAARGAITRLAGVDGDLPSERGHPALEPLTMLASFYLLADALTLARGLDPDAPPHLSKVTRTR